MISLTIDGAVAVATLCRPPVNAINEEWVARLNEVLAEVERMEQVGVLRIRSSERVFCAGETLNPPAWQWLQKRVFDDRRNFGERQILFAAKAFIEAFPDEPLEGNPQSAVLLFARPQYRGHERRLDLFRDVGFAVEARDEIGVLGGPLVKNFEGDLLPSTPFRGIHLTHAALANQPANLVDPADYRSRR